MRQFFKSMPVKVFAVILAALLFGAVFASVSQNDTSPVTKVVSVVFMPLQKATAFVSEKLSVLDTVTGTATSFVLKRYKQEGVIFEAAAKDDRLVVSP